MNVTYRLIRKQMPINMTVLMNTSTEKWLQLIINLKKRKKKLIFINSLWAIIYGFLTMEIGLAE